MSASDAFGLNLLNHILTNANIPNIGDATGLRGSTVAGSLYVSLHTANPGEAGTQSTSEANYTGYARVAVVRSSAGWTVTAGTTSDALAALYSNAGVVTFGKATAGSNTITHFGIGSSASGAGDLLFSAALTTPLTVTSPIQPSFAVGDLSGTVA